MRSVTVDAALGEYLARIGESTNILDPSGRMLGTFTPAQQKSLRNLFDPAELKRRKEAAKKDPGKPLGEILQQLTAQGERIIK